MSFGAVDMEESGAAEEIRRLLAEIN